MMFGTRALVMATSIVTVLAGTPSNPSFQNINQCTFSCLGESLAQPAIASCSTTNTVCQCANNILLSGLQACLERTNDCGDNRVDPLQSVLRVCDAARLAAAVATLQSTPSAIGRTGSTSVGMISTSIPSTTISSAPTPTDLAAAESLLGITHPANANHNTTNHSSLPPMAIAGIAMGTLFFVLCVIVISFIIIRRRKLKASIIMSPPKKFTGDFDHHPKQKRQSAWFGNDESDMKKEDSLYDMSQTFEHDKELGLMINTGDVNRVSMIQGEHTLDRNSLYYPYPSQSVPSESPQRGSPTRISLTYAIQPQRPNVLQSPVSVEPQTSVDDFSTEPNSIRCSDQSIIRLNGFNGSNVPGIPTMHFIPATPQTNFSPISSTSRQEEDIYNYYAANPSPYKDESIDTDRSASPPPPPSTTPESSPFEDPSQTSSPVSTFAESPRTDDEQSPIDIETPVVYQHQRSHSIAYRFTAPAPYTIVNRQSQLTDSSRSSVPRMHPNPRPRPKTADNSKPPTSGLIMLKKAPRASSPYPQSPRTTHMAQLSTSSAGTLVASDQAPASPTIVSNFSMPRTHSRTYSQSWRASVERAADRAIDRICYTTVEDDHQTLTGGQDDGSERGRRRMRNSFKGVQDFFVPNGESVNGHIADNGNVVKTHSDDIV